MYKSLLLTTVTGLSGITLYAIFHDIFKINDKYLNINMFITGLLTGLSGYICGYHNKSLIQLLEK